MMIYLVASYVEPLTHVSDLNYMAFQDEHEANLVAKRLLEQLFGDRPTVKIRSCALGFRAIDEATFTRVGTSLVRCLEVECSQELV